MNATQLLKMHAGRERALRAKRTADEAAVMSYREWSRAEATAWARYQREDEPLMKLQLGRAWRDMMAAMPTAPPDSSPAWS